MIKGTKCVCVGGGVEMQGEWGGWGKEIEWTRKTILLSNFFPFIHVTDFRQVQDFQTF